MTRNNKVLLAVVALVAIVVALLVVTNERADATPPDKVYVCKYVGTPYVDEVLQTGNNPISVSTNAIPGAGSLTAENIVGYEFADGQGQSIVIAVDSQVGGGQSNEPSIEDCPAPRTPPTDVCPNIEGAQATIPDGYIVDVSGNCVVPTPVTPPVTPETPVVTPEVPVITPEVPVTTPEVPSETPVAVPTPEVETPNPTKDPEPKPEPKPTPEKETPVATPSIPTGEVKTSVQCEDGVFVTKVYKGAQVISTSSAGSCGADTEPAFSVGETG